MTVHAYAAARRDVEVPRPDCPTCSAPMSFWGYYSRPVRVGEELRVLVRRARCAECAVSHALLPDFAVPGRLDGVEVIGAAIEEMATGAGARAAARRAGVPHTTARGWRRRFLARAVILATGFLAATVALGDLVPRSEAGAIPSALSAMRSAVAAARRRLTANGSDWRIALCIVGGHLLSTNTNPPFLAS
ncbi:MAG TPA: DUF6431 domain-containing protein [Clostridia bacterium]|nr:DUF6431 domain-containing protein [Clostridia bacterium]